MDNLYNLPSNISLLISDHVVVFLSFLLLIWYLIIRHNKHSNNSQLLRLPPGPRSLPVIGDMHRLGTFPHKSLQKMSNEYGDIFFLKLGQVPTVVVSSADLAERITKTHDLDFCSRPQRKAFKKFSYNFLDVAFSPYGDTWRHLRKLYITELLSSKRVEMNRSIREEMVGKMIHEIAKHASMRPEESIDLRSMIGELVKNNIFTIMIGKIWTAYDKNERERIQTAFNDTNILLGDHFCVEDYFPWAGWFDVLSGYNKRLEETFSTLGKYCDEVIEKRLDDKIFKEEHEKDFLDLLLQMEKDSLITRDHVKANLSIVALGAIDTSLATVIWTISELMQNKRVMTAAQEELRRVCGNNGKVEDRDRGKLPYLRAVVKESLRLHIPGPLLIPRESLRQTTINGYDIPDKAMVLINVYSVSRDPRYWDDPLSFRPERFLDVDIDYIGQNFSYLPFGAGRRSCPGIQYGVAIVELAVANLIYAFDWELPAMMKDGVDMSEKMGLVVSKKTPLLAIPKIAVPISHLN